MLLSFAQLGHYGRLGNQLFQIAATIGLATKHNMLPAFPNWEYSKYFNLSGKVVKMSPEDILNAVNNKNDWQRYTEIFFNHTNIELDSNCNIDLIGYFQSEKYFAHCAKMILGYLCFNAGGVNPPYFPEFNSCAVHVRRGDYVNHPCYHSINLNYYREAIDHMDQSTTLYIFSDDIAWCKANFTKEITLNRPLVFVEGNSDIVDLYLMAHCRNHIIANSTFSWWGAWLGQSSTQTVIAPDKWFAGEFAQKNNTKDVIPDRWIKLPC